jgi:hypothetical protein
MPHTQSAKLNLWINDNLVVNLKHFNSNYERAWLISIKKIVYKYYSDWGIHGEAMERVSLQATDIEFNESGAALYYPTAFDYKNFKYNKIITGKSIDKEILNNKKRFQSK